MMQIRRTAGSAVCLAHCVATVENNNAEIKKILTGVAIKKFLARPGFRVINLLLNIGRIDLCALLFQSVLPMRYRFTKFPLLKIQIALDDHAPLHYHPNAPEPFLSCLRLNLIDSI